MQKNVQYIKKRAEFVQLSFENREKAAKLLHQYADGLENCKTTSDVIFALQNILCISERTIFRDLKNDYL